MWGGERKKGQQLTFIDGGFHSKILFEACGPPLLPAANEVHRRCFLSLLTVHAIAQETSGFLHKCTGGLLPHLIIKPAALITTQESHGRLKTEARSVRLGKEPSLLECAPLMCSTGLALRKASGLYRFPLILGMLRLGFSSSSLEQGP